jgi:hypothetical protein
MENVPWKQSNIKQIACGFDYIFVLTDIGLFLLCHPQMYLI